MASRRYRPSHIAQHALAHRHAPTLSEARLWQSLRGSQLGVVFRRQVVIGRYIADFAAASSRLVVEVDGGSHVGRAAADARRDRYLARLGYRVVRVSHEAVLTQHAEVVALVRVALALQAS